MSAIYKTLQLADARRIVDAAAKKAAELKQNVCVAVVDAGGNLLALERADAAMIAAIDHATRKAWTARAFNSDTYDLAQREDLMADERSLLISGGIPVLQDGVVVGAVGIAGGRTAEEDREIAKSGAAAF